MQTIIGLLFCAVAHALIVREIQHKPSEKKSVYTMCLQNEVKGTGNNNTHYKWKTQGNVTHL